MNSLKNNHPEFWKFIKFNITMIVTSLLDVLSYLVFLYLVFKGYNDVPLEGNAILSLLGIRYKGYLYSYILSTSLGYIAAYLINRKITFKSDINVAYSSILYFILAVFNIFVSSYIGSVFGSYVFEKGITNPIIEIASKLIIINIPTLWTYPLERYVIQINKKVDKNLIIATDLDGTLLDGQSNLSKENISAIESLSKNGIETIVLTGRTFYEIPIELRECKYINYYVYSNGAGINHRYKGIIKYNPIDDDFATKIYDVLSEYETFIEIYSNFTPYVDKKKFSDSDFEFYNIDKSFVPEMHKSRVPVDSLSDILFSEAYKIEMFNVFFKYDNELVECKNRLRSEFGNLEILTSMSNNLEILNAGINKGTALKNVCKYAGFDLKNVIVIGDSKNDISAFLVASKKYAVSNACEQLKNIADRIICSNEQNVMCYLQEELI